MTDILIREVPPEVVAAVDARARRLGLSRTEYLRRQLIQDAASQSQAVTMDDLDWFADTFADLDDPDVMARAWE
ncbi:MAG: ribbon-helix-helix protein, CopG family [Pseudonocardiaceae bacterium]|nr:ribbon-helix-helix protein, CopG family [Pseudonocardiaceae bacterium]